jgi:hypothetical protein
MMNFSWVSTKSRSWDGFHKHPSFSSEVLGGKPPVKYAKFEAMTAALVEIISLLGCDAALDGFRRFERIAVSSYSGSSSPRREQACLLDPEYDTSIPTLSHN